MIFTKNSISRFTTTALKSQPRLAFIGGGNMSKAIIGGLLNKNFNPKSITVSEPNPEGFKLLSQQFKEINLTNKNHEAIDNSDAVILGVKPNIVKPVLTDSKFQSQLESICKSKENPPVVISIAAGIKVNSMRRNLQGLPKVDIVRAMPNTPALVGLGAIGLYCDESTTQNSKDISELVLSSVTSEECKSLVWVDKENHIDTVTAVSGSGPAYYFYFMQLMAQEGVRLGLSPDQALRLVTATALGASQMVVNQCLNVKDNSQDQIDLEELRKRVTSPNGTTFQAIESFKLNAGLQTQVSKAMQACYDRSIELGNQDDN